MKLKPLEPLIEGKIQRLAIRLQDLRKRLGAKQHPSEEIWKEAVELCEVAPLSRVAEGIGVSNNGLRNQRKRNPEGNTPRPSHFLEVQSLASSLPVLSPAMVRPSVLGSELVRGIEIFREDGALLRIVDLQAHGIELHGLIREFLTSDLFATGGGRT